MPPFADRFSFGQTVLASQQGITAHLDAEDIVTRREETGCLFGRDMPGPPWGPEDPRMIEDGGKGTQRHGRGRRRAPYRMGRVGDGPRHQESQQQRQGPQQREPRSVGPGQRGVGRRSQHQPEFEITNRATPVGATAKTNESIT